MNRRNREGTHTKLDSRALIIAMAAVIMAMAAEDRFSIAPLIFYALFPLHLIALSRADSVLLLRRLAVAAPFLLMIAAPAPFFERTAVSTPLGNISGGWFSGASLILRGFIAVLSALLVGEIASASGIHAALRAMRLPAPLTEQLMIMQRYSALLEEEAGAVLRSARLRGMRGLPGIALASSMLSSLMGRALERADRIMVAMHARGYSGLMVMHEMPRLSFQETAYILFWIGYAVSIRVLHPSTMLERFISA